MAVNIGPKIGVDGESDYREAMNRIISTAKTLGAEMKMVTARFGENSDAAKQSQNASRILTAQIENQKKAISEMSEMLKKANSSLSEGDLRTDSYQQNIYKANAELAKMEAELKKVSEAVVIDGIEQLKDNLENLSQQSKTLGSEMKVVTASFDENATAAEKSQAKSQILTRQIEVQKEKISALSTALQKYGQAYGENDAKTLEWKQSVNEATAELYDLEAELKKTNAELSLEKSIMDSTKGSVNGISGVFSTLKDKITAASDAKKANKVILSEVKAEYEASKSKVNALTEAVIKSAREQGSHSDETKALTERLKEARDEMDRLGSEFRTAQQNAGGLGAAFSSIGDKAKAAVSGGINGLGNAIKTGFNGAVHIGISAAQAFAKAVAAVGAAAAAGIVALGKIGLEYNSQMESYTTNFETMLGSQEAAAKKVSELKEMAAKTPFEMGDLADATQQLLAMGVASEDTGKYLQQLGDISLGDKEKLNSLVNAFGKMNSTGKVTLEYINMMAEQGFNPLNVIAQQTGESMTDLYARVSDGKVSLDEIKNAMQVATSAGGQFAGGMEKASKTTQGMISTLKDNAKALVGEVFQPISDGLKDKLLPSALDAISRLTTEFRENGINGMVTAAGDIIADTLGQFAGSLPDFVNTALDIVKSLGSGIKNNQHEIADGVVKTITTLVSGLIDALPDLLKTGASLLLEIAKGLAQSLPEIAKQATDMVTELINTLWEHRWDILQAGADIVGGIMDGIASVWRSLVDWFNGLWDSLFSGRTVDINVNANAHGGGGGSFDGSHASGLDYVPWDNYIANLHKGEMVLTRSQADMLRNTGYMYLPQNGGGGQAQSTQKVYNFSGISIQIYQQPGEDEDALLDRLEDRMQTKVMREVAAVGG